MACLSEQGIGFPGVKGIVALTVGIVCPAAQRSYRFRRCCAMPTRGSMVNPDGGYGAIDRVIVTVGDRHCGQSPLSVDVVTVG